MAILITGIPGVGKTTVLKRLADKVGDRASGFITIEIRESGRRIGFDIVTFEGRRGILARKGLNSPHRVGGYGVDIESFDRIAIPAIELASNKILIIDEIGKMELFSRKFREAVITALDSKMPVVAAIMQKSHPFADAIKSRSDCGIIEVTRSNRDRLPERLIKLCGA